VELRDHVGCGDVTVVSEHPFHVGRHRDAPGAGQEVADAEPGDLHRGIVGYELFDVLGQAVAVVRERGVPGAVTDLVGILGGSGVRGG
jgi:hypothetical protein